MLNLTLPDLLLRIAIIVISLTVHEFAHSLMAIRLGDDTPRRDGRLTLNPMAHIDIVGFILLIIAGFGWAKPVRIDTSKLKRPRRDEILISLAGPISNVLFAVFAALLFKAFLLAAPSTSPDMLRKVFTVFTLAAAMNLGLALFNLLPIPPLDGSHLISVFLTRWNTAAAVNFFRYGSLALLGLIVVERFSKIDILPIGRVTTFLVFDVLYRLLAI